MKNTFSALAITSLLILTSQLVLAGSATWNLNPTSGDWNTATNWMPATIPNGLTAVATFGASNQTGVVNGEPIVLDHIAFTAGASAFTITVGPQGSRDFDPTLMLNGVGIVNDSGSTQNFATVDSDLNSAVGEIDFNNNATAGDGTAFTNNGGAQTAGKIVFFDTSNAGSATIVNEGGNPIPATTFNEDSSAANATITNEGGPIGGGYGATNFFNNSSAGNATFVNEGGVLDIGLGGLVGFSDTASGGTANFTLMRGGTRSLGGSVIFGASSTADHATITAEGAGDNRVQAGLVSFSETATAGDSVITLQGGENAKTSGGILTFRANSTAGNCTVIAMNSTTMGSGAPINFLDDSLGGTARLEILGPAPGVGLLFIDGHNAPGVSVGSIEGAGQVTLGQNSLTVGTNNLSTTFSGRIVDGVNGSGGSFTKTGTGALSLSGANTYTGATTVNQGVLLVSNTNGSATGTGRVSVNTGTLGGSGIISGAVTVGTSSGSGASLAPAFGSRKQVTLTLQSSVTLQADATYTYGFKARQSQARTDLLITNGATITGAKIKLKGKTQGTVTPGLVITVISNTSANPINGTFSNLADGSVVTIGGANFQANYEGGDGNDLTLTVVP